MSVTVQAILQEPTAASLNNVNEFYVPNILSFNLKKTPEDRLQTPETADSSNHQNGDIVPEESNEHLNMSPRKKSLKGKQQTSSFLLEPFLKPVANQLESNKENPVLKALFGGKSPPASLSPWPYVAKNSVNCHPFKRTEFSHDLNTDDTPVQVPQALARKIPIKKNPPPIPEKKVETKETAVLKETQVKQVKSDFSVPSDLCFSKTCPVNSQPQKALKESSEVKKEAEKGIFPKKNKFFSQSVLSTTTIKPRNLYVNCERLIKLRTIVDNAIKNHKVYSMTGCYYSVRNALKQRGWIEKIDNDVKGRRKFNRYEELGIYDAAFQFVQKYQTTTAMRLSVQSNSGFAHNDQIHYTGQGEAEIMNKMLKNVTEDLCWLSRPYPYYCWKDFDKFEMVNRLPRAYFSNKIGLCNSLQQIQWFYESGVCSTQYPRTYNVSTKDEVEAFKDDFKLTACIGTLKWFVHTYKTEGENAVRSTDGKIDMSVIEFALRRCSEFVKTKQHEDIDIAETPTVWEYQWDQFITQYYKLVNYGQKLRDNKEGITTKAVFLNVQSMLNILKPYWPQFDIDGYHNFWIVKPGGRCCGAGIVIKNNLEQILLTINPNSVRETRFVVQKYIERPLLIHNTKFDIRQWFLVTNVYPLTIWMYKECYLRFCSQPFSLKNTHESIHLCNNAIQRKYKNGKRDRGLPDENMWDCYTFQTYLKAIGHPEAWEKYIYPGMKEGFIGALLASQDTMERKKNCFELYGADFMISDTLSDGPWLIEINSNPAMDSSTSVTARMCPQVLEDIIKVVIDRRDSKTASTGGFEMVFKQNCPPVPPYLGISLCVKGKKAFRATGDNKLVIKKSKTKKPSDSLHYTDTEEESLAEEIISVIPSPQDPDIFNKELSSADEANTENKESGNKRRRIDWVRKNIENLKAIQSVNRPKNSLDSTPENVRPSTESKLNSDKIFREKILQLLSTSEVGSFMKNLKKLKEMENVKDKKTVISLEDLFAKGTEKSGSTAERKMSENFAEKWNTFLQWCREKEGENVQLDALIKEINEATGILSKSSTKSCPNFDAVFQKELEYMEAEEKNKTGKTKSQESFESYYSIESERSKTSLEYFKEWKSILSETRRTCEDLLNNLSTFNEENSKVKFQKAVKKRMKDEVDFVKRLKQRKRNKENLKVKIEKYYQERKRKPKIEDYRATAKIWDTDRGLTPLAINSENGAVRNIHYNLRNVKQRSRSLLPNGSSGHGRKINVSSEGPRYH